MTAPFSLFEAAEPRQDVLTGALTDAIFAASLDEVVSGTAPPVYGNAALFFANTYPSAGLRSLLGEALGRIGGGRPDGAPVIRLETNLGGGKTHNLIALYHAAKGGLDQMAAMEFMDPALLPTTRIDRISAFVGTSAGATSFPTVDGIKPQTLWGYLAVQLGGAAAYELVRIDDENLTAAGADDLSRILGGQPALILIDEIARYLAVAEGRPVGGKTLATQTTAFLMALMEAVSRQPNSCLVITTTSVADAFGDQTAAILAAMSEAQALIARKEHVLRPSDEADLPRILARRLFEHLSSQGGSQAGDVYAEAVASAFARGADLPERMTSAAWAAEVERAWPFHPDLLTVLDKRLATIPNFQRTRGALRLLARTVRLLWRTRPPGTQAIHLHHIDLSDKETAEDLSSRLDKATLEPVIRADIASQPGGEQSHAEQVDTQMQSGVPYARRLATAAYLYSLTRDVPGAPASSLIGAVFQPGDDHNVIAKALDNLEASAWYLHTDTHGFRFSVEPSLIKLIQEAERIISLIRVKQEATDILARQFRDSALKVRRTWEDSKVPDRDDDAWLVLLHWDEFGGDHGVGGPSAPIPRQIEEIWERTPAGGVREYRNRLVFLAPSSANHEPMLRAIRRHLALRDLSGSSETVRALPDEKRKELSDQLKESALLARIAVSNHLNLLYVPMARGLEPVELDVVTQASVRPNQTDAILERLAAMEKTLAAGDKPLDPAYIRSKLGELLSRPQPSLELVRGFARRTDLKLVLDRAQITALVQAGIRNGVWEYHDLERGDQGWATKARPEVAVRLAVDTLIYPVGSAPVPEDKPGITLPPPSPPDPLSGGVISTSGNAGVSVQQAREQAVVAGHTNIRGIEISVDEIGQGMATVLAKLQSVIPAGQSGATIIYKVAITVDLGAPDHSLSLSFAGPPAEYQPLKPALDHLLRQHEATLRAALIATFAPTITLSGEEMEAIRRRAADTGPDKCEFRLMASSLA